MMGGQGEGLPRRSTQRGPGKGQSRHAMTAKKGCIRKDRQTCPNGKRPLRSKKEGPFGIDYGVFELFLLFGVLCFFLSLTYSAVHLVTATFVQWPN